LYLLAHTLPLAAVPGAVVTGNASNGEVGWSGQESFPAAAGHW